MRRRLLALAAAGCLALSGCGLGDGPAPTPSPEATPTLAETQPPAEAAFALPVDPVGGWDPYGGSKSGNMTLAGLVFEGLYELDSAFQPTPVLVQEAETSEDGLTWTLTLRPGVAFSNGQELTAQLAGEAFNAARGAKSLYAARLAAVRQVSWDQDRTLTVTLTAPNARFPALLDFPIALVADQGVWGTGPYAVTETALVARQDWWRGLDLPVDRIPLVEAADAGSLFSAFQAGTLGLAADDPTGADALGYGGEFQSWEYPTSSLVYLGFQCSRGPCRSADFRRAVSQALDRRQMVSDALKDAASAAALPVPQGTAGYDPALDGALALDAPAAAAALEELGYPLREDGLRRNGRQTLTLTLVVNADNPYKEAVAQAVARDLGAVGVDTEVSVLAWEEYRKALEKGEFDLYLAECRLTGDLDPSPLITPGSGVCFGGFRDGELTALAAQAKATGEWTACLERWTEQVPVAALCFKKARMLTRWGQVSGAAPTQGNLFAGFSRWHIG